VLIVTCLFFFSSFRQPLLPSRFYHTSITTCRRFPRRSYHFIPPICPPRRRFASFRRLLSASSVRFTPHGFFHVGHRFFRLSVRSFLLTISSRPTSAILPVSSAMGQTPVTTFCQKAGKIFQICALSAAIFVRHAVVSPEAVLQLFFRCWACAEDLLSRQAAFRRYSHAREA